MGRGLGQACGVVALLGCKTFSFVNLEWVGAQSRSTRRDEAPTGAYLLRYQVEFAATTAANKEESVIATTMTIAFSKGKKFGESEALNTPRFNSLSGHWYRH